MNVQKIPIDCFFSNQGWLEASKTVPTNSSIVTVGTTSLLPDFKP